MHSYANTFLDARLDICISLYHFYYILVDVKIKQNVILEIRFKISGNIAEKD